MFRTRMIVSLAAAALLAATAGPAFAQAQNASEAEPVRVKLATIDVDAIQRDAAAIKDIRTQIDGYRDAFRNEIEKENEALRTADQELRRQRTILAPDAYTAERQKFESRVVEVQRLAQKRRQDLDNAFRKAMLTVQKTLNQVVQQTAEDAKLTLILRTDQLVFRHPALDITKVVLDRLNETLPKVKVAEPGKD